MTPLNICQKLEAEFGSKETYKNLQIKHSAQRKTNN